jgi:F-type H+-transporting ATPase subunit delta
MIRMGVVVRYSRALADVAFESNQVEAVSADLATYCEIFQAVPGILDAFHSPAVPRDTKQNILARLLLQYPVIPITANFMRLLLDHNRILYFATIYEDFLRTVNERKGVMTARVTTAVPLSDSDLSKLRQSLSEITGKNIALSLETNADLVGGVVIQIGSTVFDGSIRTQLAEMKQRLMA